MYCHLEKNTYLDETLLLGKVFMRQPLTIHELNEFVWVIYNTLSYKTKVLVQGKFCLNNEKRVLLIGGMKRIMLM